MRFKVFFRGNAAGLAARWVYWIFEAIIINERGWRGLWVNNAYKNICTFSLGFH